jgi:hypothetical protein
MKFVTLYGIRLFISEFKDLKPGHNPDPTVSSLLPYTLFKFNVNELKYRQSRHFDNTVIVKFDVKFW